MIFTNRRILHFPARINFSPRKSVAQIAYGDIGEWKLRGGFLSRLLALKYKSGRQEKFYYLQPQEFKKLKAMLPALAGNGQPSEFKERHHLCPRCQTPLQKDRFSCLHCHLKFKDRQEAVRRSLWYPGGGYFYTRHPFLGIGDAIVEGILLIVLIVGLFEIFTETAGPEAWGGLIVIAVFLFFEKVISIYHARHYISEYIPVEENFVPVTPQPHL